MTGRVDTVLVGNGLDRSAVSIRGRAMLAPTMKLKIYAKPVGRDDPVAPPPGETDCHVAGAPRNDRQFNCNAIVGGGVPDAPQTVGNGLDRSARSVSLTALPQGEQGDWKISP